MNYSLPISKNAVWIAAAIACASFLMSCKGNSTSPLGTSTFAGRIALFDSAGHAINDFSGVTVQLDNTNLQTATNADGSWEIDNVPAGQYDISATKSGFGTFYWYEQTATGGRYDLSTAGLAEMPNIVPNPPTPAIGYGVLELGGPFSDSNHHWLEPYVDADSSVEPSSPHLSMPSGEAEQYISIDDLRAAGVQPGQKIYVSYAWVFDSYGDLDSRQYEYKFYDPRHQETRYASNGPKSKVFEVTMPQ